MVNIAWILFFVFFPLIILLLCNRFKIMNRIGPVVLAYVFGLIIGNTDILPGSFENIQNILTMVTIPLALPLLLFSSDLKRWLHLAPRALISMIAGLVSVVIMVFIGTFWFGDKIPDAWKVGGMLIGVYSGGTPNLGAIKTALDVNPDIFIMTHTYDLILSAIFLLFLMTVGKKVFSFILPAFFGESKGDGEEYDFNGKELFWGLHKKYYTVSLLKGFGLAVLIFAFGGGLSLILPESIQMTVVILTITSLGILFSLVPSINKLEKTYELGMYFILIFSLTVASMADISQLTKISHSLFYFVALAVFGSLIVHVFLSRIFNIDTDTVIVTSTALICSPPFVPVVAGAINNRQVILSGISVGIIGFAIGNYLGIFIAYLLKF